MDRLRVRMNIILVYIYDGHPKSFRPRHTFVIHPGSFCYRSVPLAYRSLTPRFGLPGPALSVADDLPTTTVVDHDVEDESKCDDDVGGCVAYCRMSHRDKLTIINFCVTNMCAGCFYSLLGPFFPTEVSSAIGQSVKH